MKKSIFEVMKKQAEDILGNLTFSVLDVARIENVDNDTGEIKKFTRYDVEVPRKNGIFSRCRFSVKVAETTPKISEITDDDDFFVIFSNLEISFIDSRGTVYFRAENAIITDEE